MSGHSKWKKIKGKKGASDEKRGKIFSKLSKEISVAARGGGDPDFNFQLRLAIDRAKAENMPKDNIDRAIAKGAGAGEGGGLKEIVYEGFGPAGAAVIVTALTDNLNRTASDIKHIFTKNGGSLGGPGSVMWQFEKLGVIRFCSPLCNQGGVRGGLELELIEAGAEDIKHEDDETIIYTKVENLKKVKDVIDKEGIKIESADIEYVAKEEKELNPDDEDKVEKFMEALDDSDDVSEVFTNVK
ncbi:YebC/PmpR family DNA-binding transcriptional regulator [Patescibacteria group bacterium]|nr:YebC/PmpR family DNA-binding transcriptional regulator [Patescibacteria group bacterium]